MSNKYQFPVVIANLSAGNQAASQLDQDYDAAARMGTLMCTAAGTNVVTLTAITNYPTMVAYGNYQKVGFIAPATPSGSVTLGVSPLSSIPAYRNNGTTQLGASDYTSGDYLEFAYNLALNSGGGGWQLIYQQASASNGASDVLIAHTAGAGAAVTLTGITGVYNKYLLVITNFQPATNMAYLRLQVSESGTPKASSYDWVSQAVSTGSTVAAITNSTSDSGYAISGTVGVANNSYLNADVIMRNLSSSAVTKYMQADGTLYDGSNSRRFMSQGQYFGTPGTVTEIVALPSSGTITTITMAMYGLKTS